MCGTWSNQCLPTCACNGSGWHTRVASAVPTWTSLARQLEFPALSSLLRDAPPGSCLVPFTELARGSDSALLLGGLAPSDVAAALGRSRRDGGLIACPDRPACGGCDGAAAVGVLAAAAPPPPPAPADAQPGTQLEPPGGPGAGQSGVLWRMTIEPLERGEGLHHRRSPSLVSFPNSIFVRDGELHSSLETPGLLLLTAMAFQHTFLYVREWDRWGSVTEIDKGGEEISLTASSSHNLVMKHLPGADPELVLLNLKYEELERIPLSDMTREEINQLVLDLRFYRKESPDSPVPEEFQLAPAQPLPTLEEAKEVPVAKRKGVAEDL
uniref:Uncharacterized protein n=1 Tax=Sphaerodactylus townsendi TaxID=933632 RepID=A0ACB8FYL7_9SAUR